MKAYDIAMFNIIIGFMYQIFKDLLNPLGFIETAFVSVPASEIRMTDPVGSFNLLTASAELIMLAFTLIPEFFVIIYKSILVFPILQDVGLPATFVAMVSAACYLIYAVAFLQIWLNRNVAASE